ncbi:MAG TPA: hypothetical protein VFA81_12125 [Burkholderiales bacterium]|nr:hypothetical protein [Burkholderiales bacterium]
MKIKQLTREKLVRQQDPDGVVLTLSQEEWVELMMTLPYESGKLTIRDKLSNAFYANLG